MLFSTSSFRILISILEDFSITSNAHLSVKNNFSKSLLFKLFSLCFSCFNSFFNESRDTNVSLFINFSAFSLSIQNSRAISFASSFNNFFSSKAHGFLLFFSILIVLFYLAISTLF
jgi:hypothetical protein